jgi:hypothetical protein
VQEAIDDVSLYPRETRPYTAFGPPDELAFYRSYSWCVDALPRFHDAAENLFLELCRLDAELERWPRS